MTWCARWRDSPKALPEPQGVGAPPEGGDVVQPARSCPVQPGVQLCRKSQNPGCKEQRARGLASAPGLAGLLAGLLAGWLAGWHGADVSVTTYDGRTPLHLAAVLGSKKVSYLARFLSLSLSLALSLSSFQFSLSVSPVSLHLTMSFYLSRSHSLSLLALPPLRP